MWDEWWTTVLTQNAGGFNADHGSNVRYHLGPRPSDSESKCITNAVDLARVARLLV